MFGSGITISFLLVYLVQIGLLPEQIMNALSRKFDMTSRRFLTLSLIFFAFNSNWLVISYFGIDTSYLGKILELAIAFTLATYLYRYIHVEMGINLKSTKIVQLVVYLFFLICVCILTIGQIGYLEFSTIKILNYVTFQSLSLFFGVNTLRIILAENDVQKPIFYSAIISVVIGVFIPTSQFFLETDTLKYLIVNLIHFALLSSYIAHRYSQLKVESKVLMKHAPQTISFLNENRFVLEEIEALTVTHGITPRELEIAKLILTGYTTNDIAKRLFITDGVVRKHASNIYKKIGIDQDVKKKRSHFKKMFS